MITFERFIFVMLLGAAFLAGWHRGDKNGLNRAPEYVALQEARDKKWEEEASRDITEMKFSDDPYYDACQKIFWIVEDRLIEDSIQDNPFQDLIPDYRH